MAFTAPGRRTVRTSRVQPCATTHRPLSSSFLGLPYGILSINPRKELLRGLWAESAESIEGPEAVA